MSWGTLQMGSLELHEVDILGDVTNANTGERTVRLDGRESVPSLTLAQLGAKQEDFMTLLGRVMPVVFQRKTEYTGYYEMNDINTEFEKWAEGPGQMRWSATMRFIGPPNAVDVESRLTNVARLNDFTLIGERWHAPAIGHTNYFTGSTLPSVVTRTGADGAITVYRDLPAGVNPRWSAEPAAYNAGRASLLVDGIVRAGAGIRAAGTGWELNNGLVRVKPGGNTLLVAAYTGGAWHDKSWGVFVTSSLLIGVFDQMTVLRNDPECVVIRLTESLVPGSAMMDLTLRRGSRFVEGFLQRGNAPDELKVRLATLEANTLFPGYVTANANDADGNRFVAGSSQTFTAHANGGVVRAAEATLDFFVGVAAGGGAAVGGDIAADLVDQYIGVMPEKTGVSRR